ncbi:mucin-5AC-like [Penaeus monodon]|uniref:mucin-5AC-like n=1 Tax=Penaeus monodon TaxID=6687 RepID=UPI0018A761A0|nr:mucin-5AC-like [Penaeus monodon]
MLVERLETSLLRSYMQYLVRERIQYSFTLIKILIEHQLQGCSTSIYNLLMLQLSPYKFSILAVKQGEKRLCSFSAYYCYDSQNLSRSEVGNSKCRAIGGLCITGECTISRGKQDCRLGICCKQMPNNTELVLKILYNAGKMMTSKEERTDTNEENKESRPKISGSHAVCKTSDKICCKKSNGCQKRATNVEINATGLLKTLKAAKKGNFAACQIVKGKECKDNKVCCEKSKKCKELGGKTKCTSDILNPPRKCKNGKVCCEKSKKCKDLDGTCREEFKCTETTTVPGQGTSAAPGQQTTVPGQGTSAAPGQQTTVPGQGTSTAPGQQTTPAAIITTGLIAPTVSTSLSTTEAPMYAATAMTSAALTTVAITTTAPTTPLPTITAAPTVSPTQIPTTAQITTTAQTTPTPTTSPVPTFTSAPTTIQGRPTTTPAPSSPAADPVEALQSRFLALTTKDESLDNLDDSLDDAKDSLNSVSASGTTTLADTTVVDRTIRGEFTTTAGTTAAGDSPTLTNTITKVRNTTLTDTTTKQHTTIIADITTVKDNSNEASTTTIDTIAVQETSILVDTTSKADTVLNATTLIETTTLTDISTGKTAAMTDIITVTADYAVITTETGTTASARTQHNSTITAADNAAVFDGTTMTGTSPATDRMTEVDPSNVTDSVAIADTANAEDGTVLITTSLGDTTLGQFSVTDAAGAVSTKEAAETTADLGTAGEIDVQKAAVDAYTEDIDNITVQLSGKDSLLTQFVKDLIAQIVNHINVAKSWIYVERRQIRKDLPSVNQLLLEYGATTINLPPLVTEDETDDSGDESAATTVSTTAAAMSPTLTATVVLTTIPITAGSNLPTSVTTDSTSYIKLTDSTGDTSDATTDSSIKLPLK